MPSEQRQHDEERAARLHAPILVPDETEDEDWTPYLSFSETAGFDGVLSIPLLSKAGDLLGVTSCHFGSRAKPTARELNFVRVSCEFASDAIAELRWRSRISPRAYKRSPISTQKTSPRAQPLRPTTPPRHQSSEN